MYVCVRTYAENFCVKCNGSMTSKNGESESDKVKPGTIIDPFGESYLITPWNRSVARYVRTYSHIQDVNLSVVFAVVCIK